MIQLCQIQDNVVKCVSKTPTFDVFLTKLLPFLGTTTYPSFAPDFTEPAQHGIVAGKRDTDERV